LQTPLEDTPQASRPWKVQEDDGVRCRKALVLSANVVTVYYPLSLFNNVGDNSQLLVYRNPYPAKLPEECIEMDNIKMQEFTKLMS
jgi:hypothetical protein